MMVFAQNRRFFIVLSQAKIAHFWPKPPFSSFFTKETPKNRIFCLLFFNKFSTGLFDKKIILLLHPHYTTKAKKKQYWDYYKP